MKFYVSKKNLMFLPQKTFKFYAYKSPPKLDIAAKVNKTGDKFDCVRNYLVSRITLQKCKDAICKD